VTLTDAPLDYDPTAFTPLAVTTDVVLLSVVDGAVAVLLVKRADKPASGAFALPGVFVRPDEELGGAATRALHDKGGVTVRARQFQTFGSVDRDPRMRVVSIGYVAVAPFATVSPVLDDRRQLLRIDGDAVRGRTNRKLALPFDHAEIIAGAVADLRRNLDHSAFAFGLLPPEFSLRQLQEVHEAVRGERVNKPAFRKRLTESGWLEPTGRREMDQRFRPAELYRARAERRA
jgi:8-oxo-dGTP diphosphatase